MMGKRPDIKGRGRKLVKRINPRVSKLDAAIRQAGRDERAERAERDRDHLVAAAMELGFLHRKIREGTSHRYVMSTGSAWFHAQAIHDETIRANALENVRRFTARVGDTVEHALPGQAVKNKAKPDPVLDAVYEATPRLAQLVVDHWPQLNANGYPDDGYAIARALVVEVAYSELARVRGMRAPIIELGADEWFSDTVWRLRQALRELPLADVTPEHFGHIHELLEGHRIVDKRVVTSDGRRKAGVHFTPASLAERVTRRTIEPLLKCIGEQSPLVLRICDPAVGAGAFLLSAVRMLAPDVWRRGEAPDLDAAKRLVAMHCCYGVDKSRFAVHVCKLALRLECRADMMPDDWLDDNIRHGDALVGLGDEQIKNFHWKPERKATLEDAALRAKLEQLYKEAVDAAARARLQRLDELSAIARSA